MNVAVKTENIGFLTDFHIFMSNLIKNSKILPRLHKSPAKTAVSDMMVNLAMSLRRMSGVLERK